MPWEFIILLLPVHKSILEIWDSFFLLLQCEELAIDRLTKWYKIGKESWRNKRSGRGKAEGTRKMERSHGDCCTGPTKGWPVWVLRGEKAAPQGASQMPHLPSDLRPGKKKKNTNWACLFWLDGRTMAEFFLLFFKDRVWNYVAQAGLKLRDPSKLLSHPSKKLGLQTWAIVLGFDFLLLLCWLVQLNTDFWLWPGTHLLPGGSRQLNYFLESSGNPFTSWRQQGTQLFPASNKHQNSLQSWHRDINAEKLKCKI